MMLPYRLLARQLRRKNCYNDFLKYQRQLIKCENNRLRRKFLQDCKQAELIPKFLKLRIPNNGCFDEKSVHTFQKGLLNKELVRAKHEYQNLTQTLEFKRNKLKESASFNDEQANSRHLLPSILFFTRRTVETLRKSNSEVHKKKLLALSEDQGRPLFNVKNTVIIFGLDKPPPEYVL